MDREGILQGLLLLGTGFLLVGALIAIGGAISAGLIVMGVGLILSGLGGTVRFERGSFVIGGTAGSVFILIGVFLDAVEEALSQLCV